MNVKTIAVTKKEKYRTEIRTEPHHFIVDEPIEVGGLDLGPTPGELLAAALASCSSITMKLYADRKKWNLEEAVVEVDFKRDLKLNITNFVKKISLIGDLDEEQRKKLYEIASKCPVHKLLENPIKINSELI